MAINLLGNLNAFSGTNVGANTSANGLPPKNTAIPYNASVYTPSANTPKSSVTAPMGVTAKSPAVNVTPPPTTIPKSQVVNTSSFTPQQLALFQQAASLGAGVQTQNGIVGGQNTSPAPQNAPTSQPSVTAPSASPPTPAPTNTGTTNVAGANGVTNSTTGNPAVTQAGLLAQAANIASGPSADYLAQQARANQYNQALQQSYGSEAQALANIEGSPHTVNFAQGAENVIRNQALTQQQGLATAYQGAAGLLGAANTQQGQEQTGLLGAANSAAPIQVSPGNYLASPLTGVASSAAAGQQQGIQSATNWAIAQQNMQQGQDYQGQAQSLSNALQTLAPVQQAITPYMASNNLDSTGVPFVNQQINKINQQTNPAAYATMEAAVNEARSYAIQLLGSQSGANPTDVTNSVNQFDFNNFTPAQLNTFLNNLNVLGQYRLSQAQSASQAGYSANATVGTPAQGMTANPGSLESGGATPLNNLPDPVKAILGGTLGITSGVLNALGSEAGSAVGSAAGTGLAATVLGL